MSETYTIGGDALYLLKADHIAGQTFSPIETHLLQYIDLNLNSSFYTASPRVQVYLTDASHEPTGDPLLNIRIHPPTPIIPSINRVRVKIPNPFILTERTEYALLCLYELPIIGTRASWQYDSTNATYPRGHRIYSEDAGTTWTHKLYSDHIFCEFGDPPLPKPEPPPPIENFAIPVIEYIHEPSTITIALATSVPCHLTCYYTDSKPLKHHTSRVIRGLAVPWGTYFCFVGWKPVEQTEPGDTLYHTFEMPLWEFCQSKWLTFRGEVDTILSPSVGPIFKHHHSGTPPFLNGDFELWPDPAKAPTYWVKDTANPGFSNWVRETTYVYSGFYSARLEASRRNRWTFLRQEVYADPYRGKTVNFTAWNRCINIYYGQAAFWASGPGAWSQLHRFTTHAGWRLRSTTHYIDPLATKVGISVGLQANSDILRTIIWDKTNIEVVG